MKINNKKYIALKKDNTIIKSSWRTIKEVLGQTKGFEHKKLPSEDTLRRSPVFAIPQIAQALASIALIFLIINTFSEATQTSLLQGAIAYFTDGEAKTAEFYSTQVLGDWQNIENAKGKPDLDSEAGLISFNQDNSSLYQTGPEIITIGGFMSEKEVQEEQFQSAKIKFSFAIGQQQSDIEIEEQLEQTTSTEQMSFWNRVEKFFERFNSIAKAEENIVEGEDGLGNINIAEEIKRKDELSTSKEQEETTGSEHAENAQEPEPEPEPEPKLFEADGNQLRGEDEAEEEQAVDETAEKQIPSTDSIDLPQAGSEQVTSLASDVTSTSTEESTESSSSSEEIIQDTEQQATPTEPAKGPETILNPDTKIIIYWSVNGEEWHILDEISSSQTSNYLNGGYFEYDAYFLNSWQDIENLQIKFEGAVGGNTNVTAYLDSAWVEAEYVEETGDIDNEDATTTESQTATTTQDAATTTEEIATSTENIATSTDESSSGAGPDPEMPLEEPQEIEEEIIDQEATTTEHIIEELEDEATSTENIAIDLTPEISLMFRSVLGGDDNIGIQDIFKGIVKTFWIAEFEWNGEKHIFSQEDSEIEWDKSEKSLIGYVEKENSPFGIEYLLEGEELKTKLYFTNNTEYPVEKLTYRFYIRYPSDFYFNEENLTLIKGQQSIIFKPITGNNSKSAVKIFEGKYFNGAEILMEQARVETGEYFEAGITVAPQQNKKDNQAL